MIHTFHPTRAGVVWLVCTLGVFLILPSLAPAVDTDALQRKQRAQEKARVLARELVSGILDIQVRQLQENGLTDLPIYDEIRSMQVNIDALVDEQMVEVVQLLVLAQEGTRDERLENFNAARDKIRELVVRLMAERQKLLRRMQVARLAAQVRQLISLQTRTLTATESLPAQSLANRDQAALDAVQDQRDVKSMFLVLVETLADVSSWGGQVGAGASDGLRILGAAQVGTELDHAGEFLESGSFEDATTNQKAVIKGLRALLEKIEQTRGLISSDREVALKMVRDLIQDQEELREAVEQTRKPSSAETEQLVTEQAEIHKTLGKLAEMLEHSPAAEPLLEQAKASAYEAAAQLFEEDKTAAVAEQTRVIGSLAEIEEQLKHEIASQRDDKSAQELAAELERLEQLKDDLEAIADQQAQVVDKATEKAAEARRAEQAVAEALDKAQQRAEADDQDLPGVIESRIADAQAAVDQAADELADQSEAAQATRQQAAETAQDAINQALAETKAQLADAERRQLAVELGELARAAEALERAAASEREIADAADQAAQSDGLTSEQADAFAQEQSEVQAVTEKVAEGVQSAAPEVSEQLQQASKPLAEAAVQIGAAQEQPGKPSTDAAGKIAQSATQASQALEQAAAKLRDQVRASAQELVTLADGQLDDVAQVQTPVEQAMAALPQSFRDMRQQLEQAMSRAQEARAEQQRASGRDEAAKATEFAQQVAEAARLQADANRAADDVASGRANTPLDAAAKQQEAAEKASELAERAEGAMAEKLNEAAAAASEAARETLGGDPNRAEAARQAATDAIANAREQAQQVAADAEAAPPGAPDAEAQARVGQLAAEAEQMASAAAPSAAGSLADAQEQSRAAGEAIEAGDTDETSRAQQATGEALSQAVEQLQDAVDQLAKRQAELMAEQGPQAGELADAAAVVSPDAAAALRAAEQTAREVVASQRQIGDETADAAPDAVPSTELPAEPFAAGEAVQRSFERAAASLAARRQEIQHDRDIAEAIADVVEQQQTAREEISRQSDALAEMTPSGEGTDSRPTPEQVSAAQALQRATQQFAQAQRATGQGAAEISQQEQVANLPLREGLEAASQLAMGLPPEPVEALPIETPLPTGDLAEAAVDSQASDSAPTAPSEAASPSVPAAATPAGQQAAQPPSAALGTGLVPNSPEMTAQQIAGAQAMAQAEQTLALAPPQPASPLGSQMQAAATSQESGQPTPPEATGMPTPPGDATTMAEGENAQSDASQPTGSEPNSDTDNRTADGNSDANIRLRMFRDEPWFTKLPPSLRKAIEARARRRPPRGYEERLRRYFESVD